ncbi:hypothetical protein ZWY2020_014445 [Hordeum vulgare]|nr:hypothetical protein ZWY2020_014445 [Hordeum vulgare]
MRAARALRRGATHAAARPAIYGASAAVAVSVAASQEPACRAAVLARRGRRHLRGHQQDHEEHHAGDEHLVLQECCHAAATGGHRFSWLRSRENERYAYEDTSMTD